MIDTVEELIEELSVLPQNAKLIIQNSMGECAITQICNDLENEVVIEVHYID